MAGDDEDNFDDDFEDEFQIKNHQNTPDRQHWVIIYSVSSTN